MAMSPDDIFNAVRNRLMSGETFTADQVRNMGIDPNMSGLIHGADKDGTTRFPAFQFQDNKVVDRVLEINTMMNADRDPWGVWDWWVSANTYLGKDGNTYRAPVSLLHTVGDYRLRQLVEAMDED